MADSDVLVSSAFNEWQRRFIEEPEKFEHEFQTVSLYLSDLAQGKTPSYGQTCVEYLRAIIAEMAAVG